jgi:hypothetical protein
MKVHFFALAIIVSAASNAQAATCNKLHSLERQPHPMCYHQISAMVPKTCSAMNNSSLKKAFKTFNLEALAKKRCPAVPLGTKKPECRSNCGTSLIDPQCPYVEPTAPASKQLTKLLKVRSDLSVPRTSNSKKDFAKFILPLRSSKSDLLALEPTERVTCPKAKISKAAFNGNSNEHVKKTRKSTCKAHIQPVFPVRA